MIPSPRFLVPKVPSCRAHRPLRLHRFLRALCEGDPGPGAGRGAMAQPRSGDARPAPREGTPYALYQFGTSGAAVAVATAVTHPLGQLNCFLQGTWSGWVVGFDWQLAGSLKSACPSHVVPWNLAREIQVPRRHGLVMSQQSGRSLEFFFMQKIKCQETRVLYFSYNFLTTAAYHPWE